MQSLHFSEKWAPTEYFIDKAADVLLQAYFPPISQPEGLPLRIQDVKGKEWVFQFRFWPNNNSRMYVLEGVTPCIQSMQLQAGDTGTSNISLNKCTLIIVQFILTFISPWIYMPSELYARVV